MKKQILSWVGLVVLVVGGIWFYRYANKVELPIVSENGEVSGSYSIQSIMALGKPYVCNFEKNDGVSMVKGIVHTDGQKLYGEFRIKTEALKTEFNAFLVAKDGMVYTWTSLVPFGYKTKVARSASINASPREQSQIVGVQDKFEYKCSPWSAVDQTIFDTPSGITFSELK